MKLIPAIDIRGGRCVRLYKGDFSHETVYADDPVEVAAHWEQCGAPMLHIVDLDGARDGRRANAPIIEAICKAVSVPVQAGGGMRSLEDVRATLDGGASRVVLGTLALEQPDLLREALQRWGDRLAVSLDAQDGMLTTHGWLGSTTERATTAAARLAQEGVRCLIYTDISRDGTLSGPNYAGIQAVLRAAGPDVEVIASGGVGKLDDLLRLRETGVQGAIVGKALYTGDVDLQQALDALEGAGRNA
jgi:phosphoribosylformimino-5-aminoimidazole carboxamide ribotide isomerase